MKKYDFVLKHLSCPGCAAEIERELRAIEGIAGVTLDFLGRELIVYISDYSLEVKLPDLVSQIVKKIEPDIEVILASHREKEYRFRDSIYSSFKTRKTLLNVLGVLFFLIAFINLSPPFRLPLYLVSYLIIGWDVIRGALRKLFSRYIFNEHLLMTVATVGALIIGESAEAVAVMLFYQIGRFFESKIVEYSQHSIEEMQKLKPDYANLLRNGNVLKVLPEQVKIDDKILVKPGERVPLDGVIIEGNTSIDNSLLTGESYPESVVAGSSVAAGAVNLASSVTLKISREYESSTISRIIDLVRMAKSRKTKTERFITRFAAVYTPVVLALALLIAVIPPFLLSLGDFQSWFYRALIFLVISCPCALVISVPLSFFSGLAVLIRHGILVKGGVFLENLARTGTVILDKTGTLTRGKLEVSKIEPLPGVAESFLLHQAYIAESNSNHPLASAVSAEYHRQLSDHKSEELSGYKFQEIPGKGVRATKSGKAILSGRPDFLRQEGVEITDDLEGMVNGKTLIGVALNGRLLGTVEFTESLRARISETIARLKRAGIKRIVMLTGDKPDVAASVAAALGITEYYGSLLPEDKLEHINRIKKETTHKILYIGDGINDAPAMALADTGMAMGGIGSAAAIESSDIVLQTDEIDKLPGILGLARKSLNNARQNIVLALGIKSLFLLLGGLGLITIWGAVFADVGVTLLAVMNSLRLLRYRKNLF